MPDADWAAVTRVLFSAMERLEDREFLILGEPCRGQGPLSGTLGRTSRPVRTRYVQVLRIGDVLSAECVGAVSLGGTWHMDPGTIERLRALGWLTPQECRTAYGCGTPNFEQYVDLDAASGLCDVLVASLDVLGACPADLELESSGNAARLVGAASRLN